MTGEWFVHMALLGCAGYFIGTLILNITAYVLLVAEPGVTKSTIGYNAAAVAFFLMVALLNQPIP